MFTKEELYRLSMCVDHCKDAIAKLHFVSTDEYSALRKLYDKCVSEFNKAKEA